MLIERNIAPFVIFDLEPLYAALVKVDQNKSGFVLATTEKGHLLGILTDGDIRRRIINSEKIDLQTPVAQIVNTQFTSMAIDAQPERIDALFSERIRVVPLVDEY